jgi:hypothetical protein
MGLPFWCLSAICWLLNQLYYSYVSNFFYEVYGVQHLVVTVIGLGVGGTVVLKLTVYKAVNNELLWICYCTL